MKPLLLPLPPAHALAAPLAAALGAELGAIDHHHFPDGESRIRIESDPSGRRVILLAALENPDGKFLPLHFAARTARELGARSVGLVVPYLPYMRQDIRFRAGEAVAAKLMAELLSRDFDWLVTVEPHLHRIKAPAEVFTIPVALVSAAPAIADWVKNNVKDPLIVGPDSESAQWAGEVARLAGAPVIVLQKVRQGDRQVVVSPIPASAPRGRTPVLVDDIVSSGRTLVKAAARLHEAGYPPPAVAAVHGLFASDALAHLHEAGITQIATCNTVNHPSNGIDLSSAIAAMVMPLL
jgi:ribose-phosphate pyrophosphokinase